MKMNKWSWRSLSDENRSKSNKNNKLGSKTEKRETFPPSETLSILWHKSPLIRFCRTWWSKKSFLVARNNLAALNGEGEGVRGVCPRLFAPIEPGAARRRLSAIFGASGRSASRHERRFRFRFLINHLKKRNHL